MWHVLQALHGYPHWLLHLVQGCVVYIQLVVGYVYGIVYGVVDGVVGIVVVVVVGVVVVVVVVRRVVVFILSHIGFRILVRMLPPPSQE